ncbi:hypothetical protein CC1G_03386 [Coprinopsis cinerea okayama7|uniref:Amino acid transporter transmembrane domain-containing protein n=1 Tax=Coprinopsis cinerea (strain Okayama-7 / 130 / ATCC MYA-4618 / FGSC 9003) TaxID=240176 RepID=A8NR20_COPC7|nr:hypothetical protein CC1G_03386 [Coprinopsis cinerea okayama7\|eukprot:XP_001835604.2 hypothetical protein CC1G_03386 [Coprinopsis cinerea okayama7\
MATTATIAAAIAAKNRPTIPSGFPTRAPGRASRPTPLVFPDDEYDDDPILREAASRPRRSSTVSADSDSEDSPHSPVLSALDSSAALILVHDENDNANDHFEFSDDETGEDDDIVSPVFEIRRTSIPALPSLSILLYLLSPYLKLGTLNVLGSAEGVPLKHSLPALFGLAIMSAFSRQLWYLLARYLKKADIMEVFCDAFAKARGKERQRRIIRTTVKVCTAIVNALLAIVYLHESANSLLPLLSDSIFARIFIGMLFSVLILYLSTAQSLASKRVLWASWLSILSFLVWYSCVIYAHAKGKLPHEGGWFSTQPSSWQAIFMIAFAFTTTSTLPLYASLKSGTNKLISTAKTPRSRSFRILSLLSTFLATALILPLVIFAAKPNIPASRDIPPSSQAVPKFPKPSSPEGIRIALASLSSATLLLAVPQAILTVPAIPLRLGLGRTGNVPRTLTSLLIIFLATLLSFIRSSFIAHLFTPLNIALVVFTLLSTYFLPAFLHISVHFFKRPLAIVIPRTPLLQTSSSNGNGASPNGDPGPSSVSGLASGALGETQRGMPDELLQRKERALQKKQFKKRIVWDVGAWVQVWLCAAGVVVGFSLLWSS